MEIAKGEIKEFETKKEESLPKELITPPKL